MQKNRLATFGLVAGLLGGGAVGIALGVPGFAGAQTADTAVTAPAEKGQWVAGALAPLVSDGTITQAQADAVIAALEAARPAYDHGGGPGGPGNLEAAAGAIGVTVDELRGALQAGQSLAEVAQSKGVDPEQVVSALVAEFEAHLDEEVASGEHTQAEADQKLAGATDRIRAFVNGEAPAPGGRHHGPGGFPPPPASDQAPEGTSTSA